MPAFVLKLGATLVSLLTAAAAAHYVGGHLKNGGAPLHPAVVVADSPDPAGARGGRLTLTPGVRSAPGIRPVTSTYVS